MSSTFLVDAGRLRVDLVLVVDLALAHVHPRHASLPPPNGVSVREKPGEKSF